MINISILGSTGSIGSQTLDIVRFNKDIKVVGLAARSNVKLLEKQIREFKPEKVCLFDENAAVELKLLVKDLNIEIVSGMDGLIQLATMESAQVVVGAVVGMIGIQPAIEAIKAGKRLALANKETLVTAGHIIMPLTRKLNNPIYPVDSEHSAIFQSLNGEDRSKISKILLTASGGPFRGRTRDDLKNITLKDALKHPNWDMGPKVTIDSSTLINKGLEVMEAKWLFDVDVHDIQVVVQPQSIIHSMVEFVDGGIIAQLGIPDMKLPIQYAIYYPERRFMPGERLDFGKLKSISFEDPDLETFYGLKLAYDSMERGGNIPTVFNAANELAVDLFVKEKIAYLQIPELIQECMEKCRFIDNPTVEEILDTEAQVREIIKII